VRPALGARPGSLPSSFLSDASTAPDCTLPLSRTGDVWHAHVLALPRSGVRYAYRVAGPPGGGEPGSRWHPQALLLDPYAPLVAGRDVFADASRPAGAGRFSGTFDFDAPPFDWQGVQPPRTPPADVVVYEMGVRSFTSDASSGLPAERRGTYLGVVDKIPHLLSLGVTAVELLPVFEFDELEFARDRASPRAHMVNVWGYSTVAFFAPMSRYGTPGGGPARAARDFKTMVRELHRAGIEVYLDVVYNHTAEGGDGDPYVLSMRGIDAAQYYLTDPGAPPGQQFRNYSGCGNTVSCNGAPGRKLVLDSLRHWVQEYQVDGFRFDLASAMTRRHGDGEPLPAPPIIRDIALDSVLSRCKLIAEPWDCGGLFQVGSFPAWERWGEWNGLWRDTVRRFWRGNPGQKAGLATRMAGSADLYTAHGRQPTASLNFVTAHDGFSLADLVSYSAKRNGANGEGGRDGCNDNDSWNCGVEGPSSDAGVLELRGRMMRNHALSLLLSVGMPMLLMGDEYGHSKGGNNNTYGLDGPLNDFQWGQLEGARDGLFRFFAAAVAFRRAQPVLRRDAFLQPSEVSWHETEWGNSESRFLAWTLHGRGGAGSLYIAFNAHGFPITELVLPPPPHGCAWGRVADTSLPSPRDFDGAAAKRVGATYTIAPHAALLLLAVPAAPQAKL